MVTHSQILFSHILVEIQHDACSQKFVKISLKSLTQADRHTDGQTDRQRRTDRHRQTDTEMTDTDRQTHRDGRTDRQTDWCIVCRDYWCIGADRCTDVVY